MSPTTQNNALFIFLLFFCLLSTALSFVIVRPGTDAPSLNYVIFGPPDNAS